jgi:outer membrane protein OmpA-like peptidoglycan-associated protein
MRSRILALPLAALLLAFPLRALADDVSVELIGKALAGQSKPGIVLYAKKAIASATLKLRREGGRPVEIQAGSIPPGGKKELHFDAPIGMSRFEGALAVLFTDGTGGEMPLSFEVLVSEGLKVTVDEPKLDLARGRLVFVLNGAADKCEHEVIFDGKSAQRGWTRFAGEPAGTPLHIDWTPYGPDDRVLRIQLTCHDREGFFSPTVELFPWSLDIPHEDVIFATGKAEWSAEEAPKLDAALAEIRKALARYGQAISLDKMQVKLYVAGHTDTVGDTASNRTLSIARAKAIAGYFRGKGLRIPIYYVGFGEDRLVVQTPDQTDEAKNRRAEYLLGVKPPIDGSWRKL